MSESEFDEQLADLAGLDSDNDGEVDAGKKRKNRRSTSGGSAHKRRRADSPAASVEDDDGLESEEDDSNPYPLEGKYKDEADRQQLLGMSEIEREELLAERQEELQRLKDKRELNALYKNRNIEDDSVAKAAKRQHTFRGQTKEKVRKLDELKAKRKAKDDKKRRNSPQRDRSATPMDIGTESEDEDEEDGQISKAEQEEERDRKRRGESTPKNEPMTIDDMHRCRLTRQTLAEHCLAPWFGDYVKGSWVRINVGNEHSSDPIYRICEVLSLGPEMDRIYQLEGQNFNQQLEVRHGTFVKYFDMHIVSNAPFPQREFERVKAVWKDANIELPTKQQLEKRREDMKALVSQPKTEAIISSIMARKQSLRNGKMTHQELTLKRSQLAKERTLAQKRFESDEVARLDKEIEALNATEQGSGPGEEKKVDLSAQINERNRRANFEAVRKAEQVEAERKKRERKAAIANGGAVVPMDPSARVRTMPRLSYQNSRPGTPSLGTPKLKPENGKEMQRSVSPLPPSAATPAPQKPKDAASILKSIEVDLGDF